MYKVIEHITKVNKRNKATTGVIIVNPDEPAYFIPLATYADYIKFINVCATNTARTMAREFADVVFTTENINGSNRYFENRKEITIPHLYY